MRRLDHIDEVADLCIRARKRAEASEDKFLVELLDMVLVHLAQTIAANLSPSDAQDDADISQRLIM